MAKLIGAPPGYAGYDEGGYLTEAVRRKPYSVILFDEIEKAHPDVFNLLLQILDDGRLTDSKGRTVNFKNTVIIMTSNIGSQYLLDIGEDGRFREGTEEKVMNELKYYFRPEFLNRVDDIVIFKPLARKEVKEIVKLVLKDLDERLKEKDIRLIPTERALDYIVDEGWDPEYGARPIKRFIQRHVETELGRQLIKGTINNGDTALLDAGSDGIVIRKKTE